MEMNEHTRLEVADSSQVGSARRFASELARRNGMKEDDTGRVALVVTESASNLLKHAGGGELLLRALRDSMQPAVEIIALDRGPGMPNLAGSLRDGFSTSGTKGTGLGAISRLADAFDIHSAIGTGTVLYARVGTAGAESARTGAVCVAKPGESVAGDGWEVLHTSKRSLVLLADGLGHGPGAAEAATLCRSVLSRRVADSPQEILAAMHAELRPTRGAAVAVCEVDHGARLARFAGIGNIAACLLSDDTSRSMVSHRGTVGHDARRIQEFQYPFPLGTILVMNSDGLLSHWSLSRYPGVLQRHPALVAAILFRDFTRGRDDATAVVLRDAA
jgi:anti-sigma regulatory factor (Ser/Thr protein kinase)